MLNLTLKEFFDCYPEIHISGLAKRSKINDSLLRQYVSGIKEPSNSQLQRINEGLKSIVEDLKIVKLVKCKF